MGLGGTAREPADPARSQRPGGSDRRYRCGMPAGRPDVTRAGWRARCLRGGQPHPTFRCRMAARGLSKPLEVCARQKSQAGFRFKRLSYTQRGTTHESLLSAGECRRQQVGARHCGQSAMTRCLPPADAGRAGARTTAEPRATGPPSAAAPSPLLALPCRPPRCRRRRRRRSRSLPGFPAGCAAGAGAGLEEGRQHHAVTEAASHGGPSHGGQGPARHWRRRDRSANPAGDPPEGIARCAACCRWLALQP